jgi:uncharacterized protein HemY
MGKLLMLLGAGLLAVGALLHLAPGALSWFGRLPGDLRIETESTRVFVPITSMLLVSLGATVLMHLLRRLG